MTVIDAVTRRTSPPTSSGVTETKAIPTGVTLAEHPLLRTKLTQLRDALTENPEFRILLGEISALLLTEATRDLETVPREVMTPLAACPGAALARSIVLAPILRAGLGMVEGVLRLIPEATVAHIGMKRDEETRRPLSYYFNAPSNLADAEVILLDPMLATGFSASAALTQLKEAGARRLRFVCVVSCPAGIAQVRLAHPDVPIFTASVDVELDSRAYIVPGLGDAGDRCFGTL
jgi:uracil phosphoribosyltransferase